MKYDSTVGCRRSCPNVNLLNLRPCKFRFRHIPPRLFFPPPDYSKHSHIVTDSNAIRVLNIASEFQSFPMLYPRLSHMLYNPDLRILPMRTEASFHDRCRHRSSFLIIDYTNHLLSSTADPLLFYTDTVPQVKRSRSTCFRRENGPVQRHGGMVDVVVLDASHSDVKKILLTRIRVPDVNSSDPSHQASQASSIVFLFVYRF
jgi:hypothetical protein